MTPTGVPDDTEDADHVYVLMTDKYRISRNIRAHWYLQTLNTTIQEEFNNEIDIISIFSPDLNGTNEIEKSKNFNISSDSKFTFFSRKYSFVYILDLSTSVTNVDIQHSSVLTDELFAALSKCLQNLVQPVIVHGYKLCVQNIDLLLESIKTRVYDFIGLLQHNIKTEKDKLNGFFHRQHLHNNLVSADISLVNMIRFGLLTLNLLPENSHEGVVIVTDGNISFPDANTLESALAQLRLSMISCSFIQIGSPPHPDSSFGHVPYNDFMKFLSTATFGAYLSISPDYVCDYEPHSFNVFHRAFLVWSFHSGYSSFFKELRKENYDLKIWSIENPYFYSMQDDCVYDKKDQHMIRRRQLENNINASLTQVLSYRLREGFTIKQVNFKPGENNIEMLLLLPWRYNVNIEYNISAYYQPDYLTSDEDDQKLLTYEIVLESSYNFLHDVNCYAKQRKSFKSPYRMTTVKQFLATLKNFSDSDTLGIHFHHFAKNEVYRSMPEAIRSGVSLFYLPPNCNTPVIMCNNDAHLKFSQYWKPICMLDVNMCQKSSLHTLQVNILLKHDTPLPEYLYLPNAIGRYDNIQCNQAMVVLNVMLKEWSTFVLLENHSYIKLIDETNNPSCSFYLVRIISQPPCIVLHLAFIGGTSSSLRNQIVNELTSELKQCKLPTRNLSSSLVQSNASSLPKEETNVQPNAENESSHSIEVKSETLQEEKVKVEELNNSNHVNISPSTSASTNVDKRARNNSGTVSCFVLLDRPIERMLIRYEKIPSDFFTCYKYEDDLKTSNNSNASLNMFQTLTRYLCHKRFIWSTHNSPHTQRLSISSVSKILTTLTMKRIQEGFHLAYNECGIVNLVMELTMRDQVGVEFPCLVQYIIFPSNVFVRNKDSITVDDYDEESSAECGEHLIVTECWVEPQNGQVINVSNEDSHFLQGLDYEQVSLSFYNSDLEVISTLLTYEHLVSFTTYDPECPICPEELYRPIPSYYDVHSEGELGISEGVKTVALSRFNHTRYNFNLVNLLSSSQQALIKFSTLYQFFENSKTASRDPEETQLNGEQSAIAFSQERFHLNDCTNMILYSEFLAKLLHSHDKELEFSHSDSISFIEQVNQRFSSFKNGLNELFANVDQLANDDIVKFKCFCKQISTSCLVLTILPYSYEVIRKLSFIHDSTKRNTKLISELEQGNCLFGSLVAPIFLFKLTFNSLHNILLNTSENDETEKINWNLFFDFSLSCNKFYFDSVDAKPNDTALALSNEISLEHFCKSVQIHYWNSFTDAIYKSLQYGFEVDQRDVILVLEKISLKFFQHLDITDFLIYTCKHLKPLVNAYFERYPNQSIADLIAFILSPSSNDAEHYFELLSLKEIFTNANFANCQTNNDILKQNFVDLIQTHFSPIPEVGSNYYFYDYENIQREKFSLGIDLNSERHKQNLLRFYASLENGSIDLYDMIRRTYKFDFDAKEHEFHKTIKDEEYSADRDNDISLIQSKPFFVGFSYSFSLKSGPQIFKTTSIPTCLFELFSVINDPILEEIELDKLRVLLNIEIITQHYEISLATTKRVSVVSNEGPVDTTRFLNNTLDEFQVYKYFEFLSRIEWLIRDEIVSISHNSFAICPSTLQMVVEHIKKTGKSNTSFHDKVELKFIVDSDQPCIGSFQTMLRELRFSSFQLCELGNYFYVIHCSVPDSVQDSVPLIFTSSKDESFEHNPDRLVFNEEFFTEMPEESVNIVEYTIEETKNSNLSPNFWLILTLEKEQNTNIVSLYFHSRQNIYVYGLEILNELKKRLEMLCKKINQQLLLDRLDQTRACDDLLITVEDKDPYVKANIRSTLNSTPISHLQVNSNIEPELELTEDKNFKLIKKNFAPGSFACEVVWESHFSLHPRLQGKDIAFRSVLNQFTVNNRNNLYVYRGNAGSVFYMRIYEIECAKHIFSDKVSHSLPESTNTYFELIDIKSYYNDNIIDSCDIDFNTDACKNDSDKDTDSIASFNINKPNERNNQCILFNVHGLSDPADDIKKQLIVALQKKLDEAVLDTLILMLVRNPMSKFSSEDVSFIQSQNSIFENFYFMINDNYMPYMMNIKSYIRQNLSNFMSNPKYVDSNVETHFKIKIANEFHCVVDEDVFILHCQQESGKDSKGVACVILSVISKEKIPTNSTFSFVLSKHDLNDFIYGNFENITSCYPHLREGANVPFYINFQVWCCGKIDIDSLHQNLMDAIRNSLWDFNLEFKIFKLCAFEDSPSTFNSMSEPSTPKKHSEKRERRSGLSIITGMQQNFTSLEDSKFFSTQHSLKWSEKGLPQGENVKENYFDFSNCDLNLDGGLELSNVQDSKNKEIVGLSYIINGVIKPWLDFGREIQVPSMRKFTFTAVLRNSIPTIIKELNNFIKNFSPDMNIHFLMSSGQGYCEFDLNSDGFYEDGNNLMILLRHDSLWNTKLLNSDSENSFAKLYQKFKNEKSKLIFPPTFSSLKSMSDSSSNLNMSDSKTGIETEWQKCIAPRQKFLLLYVEDRYITLYLYNWSSSSSIVAIFSNLIIWHNSRSLLMQSLIMQKAGIFHHLPFKRYNFDEILTLSNVQSKDLNLNQFLIYPPTLNTKDKTNWNSNIFKNTDLLLKHSNPFDAIKDFKENKDTLSKSDFIFESKNYSFIFSNFESNSTKNLFDCFNGQFNSNYNIYIKDLKDLSKVWQLHGSKLNYPIMEKITSHVKKYGRLNHFCLTPFLFSHKWRYYISLIRDHTMPINTSRSRHLSGGHVLRTNSEHEFIISKRSRRKSGPPNMLEFSAMSHRNNSVDDCLDIAVCPHYIQEYVQYLQSLGFSSIKSPKTSNPTAKKSFEPERKNERFKTSVSFGRKTSNRNEFDKFYSIKTLLGGFFLFEIGFCEPYVYSYLYSFDSTRFSAWTKSDSFISHMNTTNFLDELDSIKMRMHLHSFTYDYHLRAIHSYISGRQLFFNQGYHLISFLDDFIKYYQKAPNYARNHVYSDHIKFESKRISADQLYNYIINHNKLYDLDVFQMNSSFPDRTNESKNEFVLIHLSSHRIPYNDENNIRQEDNFDLGVLITYQKLKEIIFVKDNNLCLKFFVLLTSQRELFPKLFPFGDNKGAFRTIRLLSSNLSNSETRKNSLLSETNDNSASKLAPITTTSLYNNFNRNPYDSLSSDMSSTYSGICDEKINYLGYFNAHEIVMLNILNEKVNETKEKLKRIIMLAEIDCKRDRLWNCLIPNGGSQIAELPISLEEFNELLSLVKSIRLDEYDHNLNQFYSFNHGWYRSLAQKLELKFEFTHRKFIGKDGYKMAFFKTNCKDCFLLFDLKNAIPFVDFKIVFKKSPQTDIDFLYLQNCNPQHHELVEDFINACTSHMWSVML